MRPHMVLLLVLIIQLFSCNSSDEKGLRFNLQKGKVYEYHSSFRVRQVEGDSLMSDVSNSYTVEVLDESAGIKTIRVNYKDFKVSMEMDQFRNDTSKRLKKEFSSMAQDMFNNVLVALKNKSILLKVNPMGKVISVEGLTEIIKPVLDTMTIPPLAKSMSIQLMQSEMGKKMVAGIFSQGFEIFPNREVKLGDSWEKDIQLNGMLPISANTVFTVKAIEGNKITLDAKSLLNNNNRKGEVLSTYLVDSRSGLVLEAQIKTMFGIPPRINSEGTITGREL